MNKKYINNIRNDYYVETYFEDNDLSPETEKTYVKHLKKFCTAVDKELADVINDCKSQQTIETEEIISSKTTDGKEVTQKRVIKFDVEGSDSLIKKYCNQFIKYCQNKGNKNTTINTGLDTIKSVFSHFGVQLHNIRRLEDDADDWSLLSKDDFKFILADCSLMHKSLILFMLSTGLRVGDCLSITIGEYMDATSDYHDFVEVDDFIDNAPDDMMGYWDFTPNKTKKKKVVCKTFNSPESNKFILQNLRRVKNDYFPRKSKNLKLTKDDALFGSKRGFYKRAPVVVSISTMYGRKNKLLYEWHVNKIKKDITDGVISAEDEEKYISMIPKFHPHACRKYFSTMIERHTSNERRYRLMEGHSPHRKIDKSYIDISKKEIKEVYDDAVIDLSIYIDDTEDINNLREELETQKQEHQKEIETIKEKHLKEIEVLKAEMEKTSKAVQDLDDKIAETRTNIPFHKVNNVILNYLRSIEKNSNDIDSNRASLLQMMVYNHVRENPADFDDNEEYLFKLVRKLDIQIELSSKDIAEQKKDLAEQINYEKISPWFTFLIQHLLKILDDDKEIRKRIHIDMNKWDYVAENYLIERGYSPNLSEADFAHLGEEPKKLAGEILIRYLETE